jgi:hypothetical protein
MRSPHLWLTMVDQSLGVGHSLNSNKVAQDKMDKALLDLSVWNAILPFSDVIVEGNHNVCKDGGCVDLFDYLYSNQTVKFDPVKYPPNKECVDWLVSADITRVPMHSSELVKHGRSNYQIKELHCF